MIARTKDNIRKTIDFLIILPIGSFFILLLVDSFSRGRNSESVFLCAFILIFAFLLNKWLKPKSLATQIDRLKEEEIHLLDKIEFHKKMIQAIKKAELENNNSRQNEIDTQQRYIEEKQSRIDVINRRLSKVELISA
ncbi:MAG: hypothetical protein AAFN10_17720 [Bacteroidota bacterium]